MAFEIKHGKPIPKITGRGRKEGFSKYPFAKMKAGDYFEVDVYRPDSDSSWKNLFGSITQCCYQYCKKNLDSNGYGEFFTFRKDRELNVICVWRIK